MTDCTNNIPAIPACKKREIDVNFNGGDVTSNGGALLIRQIERKIGLVKAASRRLSDSRRRKSCIHKFRDVLMQRVLGIALGHEDLNDHDTLRIDPAIQTAVDRDEELASTSTLSRIEAEVDAAEVLGLNEVFIEKFLDSYRRKPSEIILDFDATDDRVHGKQEGRHYNTYYDGYCFLPLYVFCKSQLLFAYLRPGWVDGAYNAGAVLRVIVNRIRHRWPNVRIIFRGDCGFLKPRILRWCDRNSVHYIVGLPKNSRLTEMSDTLIHKAEERFEKTKKSSRYFGSFSYAAKSWDRERRVIVKAEHNDRGSVPRYIVTNLKGGPKFLYEKLYCGRGDMENRIKEQQLGLFADRTSSSYWAANQYRLMLSSMAYVLMDTLRRKYLVGTQLEKAQCTTIRLKLLKIGGVITRNTRRIRIFLSSAYPLQSLFMSVLARLCPG